MIFTSPSGDGTAILRGNPSHTEPFAGRKHQQSNNHPFKKVI